MLHVKFEPYRTSGSREDFEGIFSYFFAFWLPWQPIMISSGITHMAVRRILKETFKKSLVKISSTV